MVTAPSLPGCWLFGGSGNGDEVGETGDPWGDDADDYGETEGGDPPPPDPAQPTLTDAPLVPGALWSLRWDTRNPITHADLSSLGLALANRDELALIDATTGVLTWHRSAPVEADNTALRARVDGLTWGLRVEVGDEQWRWDLHSLDADGEIAATAEVWDAGPLTLDGGGRIYAKAVDQLKAYESDGSPIVDWTRDPSPGYSILEPHGQAEGVVLIEVSEGEGEYVFDYRLRHLYAQPEEPAPADFTLSWAIIDDLALVSDRIYAADSGFFGIHGHVSAVDLGGGLAWTIDMGANAQVLVEPDPEGGVFVLVALDDVPATLARLEPDGELVELGDASSESVTSPLLVVGANGEVIAGGLDESFVLELNRLY